MDGGRISEIDKRRCLSLYDVIYRKVREKKLICPLGDQREEIELGEKHIETSYRVRSELSLGIVFCNRMGIEDEQILLAMLAYLKKETSVTIEYTSVFCKDPINTIEQVAPFIVDVFSRPSEARKVQRKQEKFQLVETLNMMKKMVKESGQTYKERLEVELLGKSVEIAVIFGEALEIKRETITPTKDQLYRLCNLSKMLYRWYECGGDADNIADFFSFLCSPQLKNMPYNKIKAQIFAKITTSDGNVKSGDVMDIDQMSAVIPFCNYLICDKTMRNILRVLKIDKAYATEILAAADCDLIIAELEKL